MSTNWKFDNAQHGADLFTPFGVKPATGEARAASTQFLGALKLFARLVNIGDAKSLATRPASTTRRQLSVRCDAMRQEF